MADETQKQGRPADLDTQTNRQAELAVRLLAGSADQKYVKLAQKIEEEGLDSLSADEISLLTEFLNVSDHPEAIALENFVSQLVAARTTSPALNAGAGQGGVRRVDQTVDSRRPESQSDGDGATDPVESVTGGTETPLTPPTAPSPFQLPESMADPSGREGLSEPFSSTTDGNAASLGTGGVTYSSQLSSPFLNQQVASDGAIRIASTTRGASDPVDSGEGTTQTVGAASSPVKSSIDSPATPVSMQSLTLSATASGSSANPFSKSAFSGIAAAAASSR